MPDEPFVAPSPPAARVSAASVAPPSASSLAAHAALHRTVSRSAASAKSVEAGAERAPPEPAPERALVPPPPDPELTLFRKAHDLHFSRAQPRAAIAAYGEYLAAYPQGRFVPEASYNLALDWLALGERQRARQLLQPFARGEYDGYRRAEAERLLKALH